jgi:primosomal replication protein N''
MAAMIRFCPKCRTDRPIAEFYCSGVVAGQPCEWDLTTEPVQEHGQRRSDTGLAVVPPATSAGLVCSNGHPITAGDLLCPECGTDIGQVAEPTPDNQIGDWALERPLPSTSEVRQSYIATRRSDGRRAVLTLYNEGSEPDPTIYDVLRATPRDHVPEIIDVGRAGRRAYEVFEEFTGGTLADLSLPPDDITALSRVVSEVGSALHSLGERGLRHRDLRPGAIQVRTRSPLDLVISSFGSARLSDFDLDVVAPLETTRYSAPEAIAGGVAAASDWWSLGMTLLEQVTRGDCFAGATDQVFLIHVLTSGAPIPEGIDPRVSLLLRGLLARERRERWGWTQVSQWLSGESPAAPRSARAEEAASGPALELAGRAHRSGASFALAAASRTAWNEARDLFLKGAVVTWAEALRLSPQSCSWLRELARTQELSEDFRFGLALKQLNPAIPFICRGEIITPGWLLEHPEQGIELISGPAPDLLLRMEAEQWIVGLKSRAAVVRQRAQELEIELSEDDLRIHLLSTSHSRLAALWAERRAHLPDSDHPALLSILERRHATEEDLILLLSAVLGQFRSPRELLDDAASQAKRAGVEFDHASAAVRLKRPRAEIYTQLDARVAGLVRSGIEQIDEWVDQFRLERRLPLARVLVVLAVHPDLWREPPGQAYVARLLDFFAKRVSSAAQRGPLSRLTIGKTSARIDLTELNTDRVTAALLLDRLLQRSDQYVEIDPAIFQDTSGLERRTRLLHSHATLYRRDTGIDGLYLGFPFLLMQEAGSTNMPRIAPVLLWPIRLRPVVGVSGRISIAFDREREEVRLNPALEGMLGSDVAVRWQAVTNDVLHRATLSSRELMDAFGTLLPCEDKSLTPLPGKSVRVRSGSARLLCSGVFFHLAYMGQAIVEDLRQLKGIPPKSTALETSLRLSEQPPAAECGSVPEIERFFTSDSDPSQEAAVFEARRAPGLVIQGPPGTGKSQTIVNMVADAVGRGKSVLVVCQKQPALEVVCRRLEAEGFNKRLVMITDVNADRRRVVSAVREQVESIGTVVSEFEQANRTRAQLAARLQSLKRDLDEHHSALHALDPATGLSYRSLLAQLMAIEAQDPGPINLPAARPALAGLDPTALVALEDEIAAVASHWLPARYEDSPLADLEQFDTDAGSLGLYEKAFDGFAAAESARDCVCERTAAALRVEDESESKRWLTAHAPALRQLTLPERERLIRWLPLFRAGEGEKRIVELAQLREAFEKLPDSENESLRVVLTRLDARGLKLWLGVVERLDTPDASFLASISPVRWLDRQRFRKFLSKLALAPVAIADFHRMVRGEAEVRPFRAQLIAVAEQLGQVGADLGSQSRSELHKAAGVLLVGLQQAQDAFRRILGSPHEAAVIDALRDQALDSLEKAETAILQGCDRYAARRRSLAATELLEPYFSQPLRGELTRVIDEDRSNRPTLDLLAGARPSLVPYQRFRARSRQLSAAAAGALRLLRSQEQLLEALPADELATVVRLTIGREARLAWKTRIESQRPAVLIERSELDARQSALRETDAGIRKITRRILVDNIDTSRIRPAREWEDITRLTGPRARRLREFITHGVDLGLMALRPVWLVNPDIASRVLPLKSGLFDLIIFDEASQMPVEFALPSLYRGQVVVVSGDEKQMPPTSFFSNRQESDEDDESDAGLEGQAAREEREALVQNWNQREIKDCPDLLQLAKAALPTRTLQIHYRSSHRELIAFSNAAFYRNDLSIPVCHPDEKVRKDRPIQLLRAEGTYENQTNEAEADLVVQTLKQHWSLPSGQRKSMGVVTFNRKQADLIEEKLEERAIQDPAFSDALSQERERVTQDGDDARFFVKNVETVQGDERDIIVFSSTFGRNAQGTFRRNFGVLGQTGGERRLNVAVTRAKERVILITSMPIAEISDLLATQRPAATARDYLQAYFEYARATSAGEFDFGRTLLSRLATEQENRMRQQRGEIDGFMRDIILFARKLGYRAVARHDPGVFGIDLVVEDPRTGLYGIGIECDAPRHSLLADARAREVWLPGLLNRTIARVHRVSSRGWYIDRKTEQHRLQEAIEAALT